MVNFKKYNPNDFIYLDDKLSYSELFKLRRKINLNIRFLNTNLLENGKGILNKKNGGMFPLPPC